MSSKTRKGTGSSRKANVGKGAEAVATTTPMATDEPVADPAAQDATPAPAAAPVAKRGGKLAAKGDATLGDVAEAYVEHLRREGKSEGTAFSYGQDLRLAREHFGDDTPVATLTPAKVANFFASDLVRKKKSGRAKSSITIAKTCRVFRLAMVWAAEQGFLEKLPIPAEELEHARGTAKKEKPETSKPARKATKPVKSATKTEEAATASTSDPATGTVAE